MRDVEGDEEELVEGAEDEEGGLLGLGREGGSERTPKGEGRGGGGRGGRSGEVLA